jgi:hypothetical protein
MSGGLFVCDNRRNPSALLAGVFHLSLPSQALKRLVEDQIIHPRPDA